MVQIKAKEYAIGVDIGGTKISGVLFDGSKVVADYTLATPQDSLEHFLIMLNAVIEPLLEKAVKNKVKVKAVGLGIVGPLDYEEKKVLNPQNIPIIHGVKLPALLEEKLNIPVMMDHDTNCFIRAEAKLGAGQKYKNIYGIIIGTGIGGSWWYDNQAYLGAHGGAGEPGWMIIDCQQGVGLEQAYHRLMQNNPGKLSQEAYRGDVLAQKAYEEFGRYLGMTLANIVNLLDPEIFIIGGGVMESADLFIAQAKKVMRQYILSPQAKTIKIVKSKLGPLAGAMGAALLVA